MTGKVECGQSHGTISWWACDYLYLWCAFFFFFYLCQKAAVTLCGSDKSLGLGAKGHALERARGYLGRGVVGHTITIVSEPSFWPLTSLVKSRVLSMDMKITAML